MNEASKEVQDICQDTERRWIKESLRWLNKPMDRIGDLELDSQIELITEMLDDLEDPIIHMDNELERELLRGRLYDLQMESLEREQTRLEFIRQQERLSDREHENCSMSCPDNCTGNDWDNYLTTIAGA